MDRRLQLTAIALLLALVSPAQCDSTRIRKVQEGTCTYIETSPEVFTKYWTSHQQLGLIRSDLPVLKAEVDSVYKAHLALTLKHEEEKKILVRKVKRTKLASLAIIILTIILCNLQ